jgi:hypothetical protein
MSKRIANSLYLFAREPIVFDRSSISVTLFGGSLAAYNQAHNVACLVYTGLRCDCRHARDVGLIAYLAYGLFAL